MIDSEEHQEHHKYNHMTKYIRLIPIMIIIAISFLTGCKNDSTIIKVNCRTINVDTIQFITRSEGYETIRHRLNDLIGLDSLEKSGDWLEIRIIRYHKDAEPLRIFVIKRRAGIWRGFIVSMRPELNRNYEKIRYVPEIEEGHASTEVDWNYLGNKLLSMGVLEIDKTIPLGDYDVSNDADNVTVEYASKDGYRKYEITEPEVHETPGKIRITEIMKLIEKEARFKNFASLEKKN